MERDSMPPTNENESYDVAIFIILVLLVIGVATIICNQTGFNFEDLKDGSTSISFYEP